MSKHSSDSQESNSLKHNLEPGSRKTEFYEQIKSLHLKRQKIAEMVDLMDNWKRSECNDERAVK